MNFYFECSRCSFELTSGGRAELPGAQEELWFTKALLCTNCLLRHVIKWIPEPQPLYLDELMAFVEGEWLDGITSERAGITSLRFLQKAEAGFGSVHGHTDIRLLHCLGCQARASLRSEWSDGNACPRCQEGQIKIIRATS